MIAISKSPIPSLGSVPGPRKSVFTITPTSQNSTAARKHGGCHKLRNTVVSLILLCLATSTLKAEQSAGATGPIPVEIGIYLLDVYDLDLKNSSYVADFYIWLRWKGDLDPRKFELMNGELDVKENPDEQKFGDTNYVSYRVRGKFRAPFDFREFPLDEQKLTIEIEDASNDAGMLEYVADLANMSASPQVNLSGWELAGTPSYKVVEHVYETNYGNPRRPPGQKAAYSRFVVDIPIKHAGNELIYLKTFIGLFISVAIAFLTFLIEPIDLDPRFGVGIAGIFGAVSSMIVVSSNMPENPYFTMSDQIHFTSLAFIFLTIFVSCAVLRLYKLGFEGLSRKVDVVSGVTLAVLYIGIVGFLSRV